MRGRALWSRLPLPPHQCKLPAFLTQTRPIFSFVLNAGATFSQNNGNITGNIGIGSGGAVQMSGPSMITGKLDFADPFSIMTSAGYQAPAGSAISNTTITGGTAVNATLVDNAITDYTNVSNAWAGVTGTTLDMSSPPTTINDTSGVLSTEGGVSAYVFTLTNAGNLSAGITIHGGPSDLVVFNVPGNLKFNNAPISLTSGLTPDQVLFNLTCSGCNNELQSSGNHSTNVVNADFIILNSTYNMNEININGRVFGGETGQTSSFVSNAYQWTPPSALVPEPASVLILLGGGLILGAAAWRHHTARSSKI